MRSAATAPTVRRANGSRPPSFQLRGLLLLDPVGNDPLPIESMTFADDGIGVVRRRGQPPRVLPWTSVIAHAVEPWGGGTVPVDQTGALISVQTLTGTYRFLRSGGDAGDLSRRIDAFAMRHRGPAGASTVTTAAGSDARDRTDAASNRWHRVRPLLVVAVVAVVVVAVTLILLQSAGLVHLPLLGGGGSGSSGPVRPGIALSNSFLQN